MVLDCLDGMAIPEILYEVISGTVGIGTLACLGDQRNNKRGGRNKTHVTVKLPASLKASRLVNCLAFR